jgi:hypothetical protein
MRAVKPLTPGQRRALTILTDRTARITPIGQAVERLEIPWVVAMALLDQRLIRDTPDGLIITQAGRHALAQPVRDTPRLLAPTARPAHTEHGYTDIPGAAMRDEPEAVTESEQAAITAQAHAVALVHRGDSYLQARHDLARAIERLDGIVDERGRKELRLMRSRLQFLDRQAKAA